MALLFEQAEEMLTPQQRSELAHCILESTPLPQNMNEAQRTFCMGLSVLCEYESRSEIFKYLL